MTVFKTFLKVLNKYKGMIILYTVLLIGFTATNMQTSDSSTDFSVTKPSVFVVNNDEFVGITKNLVDYIKNNCEIANIKGDENSIKDALFYRDIGMVIYIPDNYRNDYLSGKKVEIMVKQSGNYESSLASMLLNRYLKVANIYQGLDEDEIISNINEIMNKKVEVKMTSKLDTNSLAKATFYYNFLNYSILAGCVYVICLILSSFRGKNVCKRTIISSVDYRKYNRKLLLSNGLFATVMWVLYVILSFILVGNTMLSMHGAMYIINSFVFLMCALTLAFLIGNMLSNKNAINGIINVVALGSSFLCGAFVPSSLLPESVLKIARVMPSYWYIKSNDVIGTLESISLKTVKPVIMNMGVIVLFSILFVICSNVVYRKKMKIG